MNRLIKIFSFVLCLSFSLLFNVSYADFGSSLLGYTSISTGGGGYGSVQIGEYNVSQIYTICDNYFNNQDNSEYKTLFDMLINSLKSNGFRFITYERAPAYGNYYYILEPNVSVGVALYDSGSKYLEFTTADTSLTEGNNVYMITGNNYGITFAVPSNKCIETVYGELIYSTTTIKSLYVVSSTFSADIGWDGSSYYYEVAEEPEEEKPVPPSNSEIAQAVQNFYNSDYYKNNKDFKDFIVMYNYKTKYFDFIGHNYEDKIYQQIFPAGHKYNQQWWRFDLIGITSELAPYLTNKYYWLYSTNDFGENIKYEGKGAFKDLLDLHFSTFSIIVYSTSDYDVVYYTYDENDEFVSSEMNTIPGDQYTYDENLDPTTNEYNPIKDFIPTDPTQNILGDVDFNEINKVFEENKDILNIKNASWLFTANNQLVNYFIGFLSFLIVLIIISRLLGG